MKLQRDKVLHFTVCCIVAVCAMVFFKIIAAPLYVATLASFTISMSLGVGKEYGDKTNPYNKWDWKDIIADATGSVIGTLISITLWFL